MIKKKREITLSGILFAIFFAALLYPPFVSEELLQNEVLASYANWIALGAGVCFLLFNIREIRIDSFFSVPGLPLLCHGLLHNIGVGRYWLCRLFWSKVHASMPRCFRYVSQEFS